MSGPQAERDSKFSSRIMTNDDENQQPNYYTTASMLPTPKELLELGSVPAVGESSLYEAELAKVRKENKFLKDQTGRLTAELRKFQVQYPYLSKSGKDAIPTPPGDLPPWMVSEKVMSPIFAAYDSRIHDLSSLTEQQRMALDSFAEEVSARAEMSPAAAVAIATVEVAALLIEAIERA